MMSFSLSVFLGRELSANQGSTLIGHVYKPGINAKRRC